MVGIILKVTVVSSEELTHGKLLMVQRSVYVEPGFPLKLLPGLAAFPKLPPTPDTIDHVPVPTVGELAASTTLVSPQVEPSV
jgi:hypothetical protein